MQDSTLRGSLEFMGELGIFDTVLPFLLIFTLIFAFLEKSKVLGTEKIKVGDSVETVPKKNLNSIVAFVMGFIFVASAQLVGLMNEILAGVGMALVMIFAYLLVLGSFQEEKETPFYLQGNLNIVFQIVVILAITLIFLNAMNWLDLTIGFIASIMTTQVVTTIALILVILGFMYFVVRDPRRHRDKGSED